MLAIKSLCDVTIESCRQWSCRDDVGRGVMPPPSHAGDGAAETTWPRCDVACQVMLTTVLLSHTSTM
jgi:hypothetical protein